MEHVAGLKLDGGSLGSNPSMANAMMLGLMRVLLRLATWWMMEGGVTGSEDQNAIGFLGEWAEALTGCFDHVKNFGNGQDCFDVCFTIGVVDNGIEPVGGSREEHGDTVRILD